MSDVQLRERLVYLLEGRGAHVSFDEATRDFPPDRAGERPDGCPHSPWELLEHMRLAQRDILDFCLDEAYEAPDWPADYWPETSAPPSEAAWHESRTQFGEDRQALLRLVEDASVDLFARVPAGEEQQTFLREALLVADHNAYHLGQLVLVRRLLGLWPKAE